MMPSKRLLAQIAPPHRTCGNCVHFDLAEGQATLAEYPAFMAASAILGPDQMGIRRDEDGNPIPQPAPAEPARVSRRWQVVASLVVVLGLTVVWRLYATPYGIGAILAMTLLIMWMSLKFRVSSPAKARKRSGAKWKEMGACGRHDEIRWTGDKCGEWS